MGEISGSQLEVLKRCLVLLARAGILTGWSGVARASFCQNVGQIRAT